jgi:hypothetical protein
MSVTGFSFDEAAHLYTSDGVVVPSVTQILSECGLIDYSGVSQDVLEKKRVIGSYVHIASQFIDEGDIDWKSIDATLKGYLEAYDKFKTQTGFIPILVEHRGVASLNGSRYGWTIDRYGLLNGKPAVIELKCTAAEEKSWKVQLAGYTLALEQERPKYWTAAKLVQRVGLQLKPDGRYKCYPYSDKNIYPNCDLDFAAFTSALFLTTYKRLK